MNLLHRLFGTKPTQEAKALPVPAPTGEVAPLPFPLSTGDYITQLTDGANLVDGKQTWEFSDSDKGDLKVMLKCCKAEMATMKRAKIVAAPFYFERVAILFRKAKQYNREIEICESYVEAVEHYYASVAKGGEADVRKGPRFQAIKSRIAKARAHQSKMKS